MPAFAYRARDREGRLVQGQVDAADERAAVQALRGQGLVVTDLRAAVPAGGPRPGVGRPASRLTPGAASLPAGAAGAPLAFGPGGAPPGAAVRAAPAAPDRAVEIDLTRLARALAALGRRRRAPLRELAVFCRQFASILEAGVPILRGFAVVVNEVGDRALREALAAVAADLEAGRSLSEALAARGDVFPPLMHHLVAAGEQGGFLEETFRRLAEHFEKEDHLVQKIRSATLYPKIVAAAALLIVLVLVTVIVPSFAGVFENMGLELPLITKAILAVSAWLRRFWYLLPVPVAAVVLALRLYRRSAVGRRQLDLLALRLPVFGPLAAKRALAVFARTLGTLLQGGVPILQALDLVARTVGNVVLEEVVRAAAEDARAGQSIVGALRASPHVPRVLVEMLTVGEETGRMEEMLYRVAGFYEAEVERTAERLTSLVEPFIIVFLGGIVALILLSVFIPLFSIYQGLQQQ